MARDIYGKEGTIASMKQPLFELMVSEEQNNRQIMSKELSIPTMVIKETSRNERECIKTTETIQLMLLFVA
jgi:hypothetical protein